LKAYRALKSTNGTERTFTMRAALERLSAVPSLRKEVAEILREPLLGGQGPFSAEVVASLFERKLSRLRMKAEVLHEAIAGILATEDPLSIAIRLPDARSLDELKTIVHELQHVFEEPVKAVLGSDAGEVRFQGFDVGSEWLELVFTANGALGLVAGILRTGTWLLKEMTDAERRRAECDVTVASAEVLVKYAELDKMMLDARLAKQAAAIVAEHGATASRQGSDQELQNIVSRGVQCWANLLGRGAAAVPALSASEEIREVFPAVPQLTMNDIEPKLLNTPSTGTDTRESAPDPPTSGEDEAADNSGAPRG
jgi:hypothetical protein